MSEHSIPDADVEALARRMAAELDVSVERAIVATKRLLALGLIEPAPVASED